MRFDIAPLRSLTGLALAGSFCLGAMTSAQTRAGATGAAATELVNPIATTISSRARATTIQGGAWHADNTPIPDARIRLRNVVSGQIAAITTADDAGQFLFENIPEGPYVVELVTSRGKVLAVGHTFTVVAGETVATFVRLGPQKPWFIGLFGNTSLAVATTAVAVGVMALSPEAMPSVSPNR
jgi:hypothetical protein